MTVTASPSCSLPNYAMVRTYSVRLKEGGEHLAAEFDEEGNCVSWGWPCGFTGTRDAQTVRLTFNTDPRNDGYTFSYLVTEENAELAYEGAATGKMDDSTITAVFDGAVLLYACSGFCDGWAFARCDAPNHRLELVRK